MNMKSKTTLVLSGILAAAVSLNAGQIDGNAVLGSAIGAAAGTAVGSAVGGKDGAIIGGGVGGALGAAAGSRDEPSRTSASTRVVVADSYSEGHRDNGLHRGHHKHKHGHKGKGRD